MKTQFKSLLLFATAFGFIFNACKKGENAKQNDEVKKIIAFYEEIGRRHNEFLSRAFPVVKNKLSQKTSARVTQATITEEEMREIVIDVSSEELVPVLGVQYSQEQLYTAIQENMPQDLTFATYASTIEGVSQNVTGISLSVTFTQALSHFDAVLEQCNNYSDSSLIFSSLEQLRNQYVPLLDNPSEREAFIAGTILAKHSLRYWAENEQIVMDMFTGYAAARVNHAARIQYKPNPVKSDVRGMIIGGVRGAIQGGIWGSTIPGIGTAWGAISMGILGAGASGCVSSLAAGIWNAIFN